MISKNLLKLGSLLLVVLLVLSVTAFGQQRTWYVNNQIGSDGYDGLSATVTPPSTGPKRTINRAITEANSGDIIVIANTGVDYGTGTGEPSGGLNPGDKILTFQSTGGEPKVTVEFGVNNTAVTTTNTAAVTFGSPVWFSSGFSLVRGGVVGASNIKVSGTVTRFAYSGTDPAFDGALTYSGTVHVMYESGAVAEITTGNEFLSAGVSNVNVAATGGAIAVTLNEAKTIKGTLTTANSSTINLGGNTLTVTNTAATTHTIAGHITNGTIDFSMGHDVTVNATGVNLPAINATTTGTTTRTLALNAGTTRALTIGGPTTAAVTLSGGTSATAPSINGNVTYSGSSTLTLDRLAPAVLYHTGNLVLSGTGSVGFGANATGLTLTGNVLLNSTVTLTTAAATSNKANIIFNDIATTITGTVTNQIAIAGATDDGGNAALGVITFADGSGAATVTLGGVVLNANVTATFTSPGDLATSANIIFASTGASDNTYTLGDVTNSSTLGSSAQVAATVGRIYFANDNGGAAVTASAVTNASSYTGTPAGQGDIDFSASTGNFTAASLSTSGGKGGDIRIGNGTTAVTGNVSNARTDNSAQINIGTGTTTVGGNVTSSGSSTISFGATTNTVGITGTLNVSSGTVSFASTSGSLTFGGMTVSGGTVTLGGAGATSTINTTTVNLTGGTIALDSGTRTWNLSGSSHTIGGATTNPTFTGGAATTLNLPTPVPTIQQNVTFGPLEPSYPGHFTVTNAGGLSEAVRFSGGNFRVSGNVTFNTTSTASKVVLDGAKLYIVGSGTFTNTTGYTTLNNGFVSMSSAASNQNVGGAGDFGDFEVNTGTGTTIYSAVFQAGIGKFRGVLYLTSGTAHNGTNNITIENATVTPTIVRNEGTFAVAPVFGSKVNVTYIGRDKASSNELPTGTDKLNDLTVATTNGGNGAGTNVSGKGAAARGVVTITTSPTVNGTITVSEFQTLAIADGQNLIVNGTTVVVNGQIVNLSAANFAGPNNVMRLQRVGGTAISGSGLLPPILVESAGNSISGSKGVIDQQLGANYTVQTTGGDDVIDDTPGAANGDIRFAAVSASLTVTMGTGAGSDGTHVGGLLTADATNTLTLGANLTASGNLTHGAGTIDIGSFVLNLRGTSHSFAGGANLTGTGTLRFTQTAATTLAVTASAGTIAANVDVTTAGTTPYTLSLTTTSLTVSGNLSLSGAASLDIATGLTLTAAGSSVSMASGTAFTGAGTLRLNAATPPLTFSASGAVSLNNLRVSNGVVLSLSGTSPSVTVNTAFTHDGGNLDFGAYDLKIDGTYTKSGATSSYTATTGYLIINNATFNQGSSNFSIPNLRFLANAAATVANQTGVVTVTGKLDVRATPDISNSNTNNTTILAVADGATVNYRSGGFDVAPAYAGSIVLVVDQAASGTIVDSKVWPATPTTLVSTFRVANALSTDVVELPGNRTVNSALDIRTGVLDLGTTADYTLTVANGATITRRSTGSVVLNGGAFSFGGADINVVYQANAAMTTGAELPTTVKDMTITRSSNVANATTTVNSSVTINGILTIRNDLSIAAAALVTALGDVKVERDIAFSNATDPVFGGLGAITFGGSADQTITVPSAGAAIGSITINKTSGGNKVTITGGDLTCTGTVTFINGLVFTGDNALVLGGNTPNSAAVGFARNVATGGKSHVVGNVKVPLKIGQLLAFGRNEFPVGYEANYRPAAFTFVNPALPAGIALGITAKVGHTNARPTGIVGLPIIDGVSSGVDIARYPDFFWTISTTGSLGQQQFNLELTATGFTGYDDIANVRIIRRSGTADDQGNTWTLQGAQYDNFVIAGVPTVVNVNSTGGLIPGGAIYTYGLKSTMVVANPLAPINLTDVNPTFRRYLRDPAVFTGAQGTISYSVSIANPAIATATISNDTLIVTKKVTGQTSITITGTDAFDGSRINHVVTVSVVSDVEKTPELLPTEFALMQNYPNPFNPSTTIKFGLPKEAPVTLEIYNILGVKIRTLVAGQQMNAAFHTVVWDGRDDAGVNVPSGVYLYRIHAGEFQASKKMTLLK